MYVILHLIKKREKTEKQFHKVAPPPVSLEILSFIKRKFEIILFYILLQQRLVPFKQDSTNVKRDI